MQRKNTPALDPSVEPRQGTTRHGQPLSYNRAPAPDLAPWVARFYVAKIDMPDDYSLSCGVFNDTPVVRIQLKGEWTSQTADGVQQAGQTATFLGPQTHRMPVTVKGSFINIGIVMRPGACTVFKGPRVKDYLDRQVPLDEVGGSSDRIIGLFDPDGMPEDWIQIVEQMIRSKIREANAKQPDPLSARFEDILYRDPSMSVTNIAAECGVDRRKLERTIKRDFGMSPKQVLKRARALDMASHLLGVADANEGDEIALRYYDESHLIHEFTDLFGISPRQFIKTPQPIMTLVLETRQARRLETLHRIEPGMQRPWQ